MNLLDDALFLTITVLALILHVLCAAHALLNKRDPKSAAIWVFICLFLPAGGPLIYIVLGFNRISKRADRIMRRSGKQAGPDRISSQVDLQDGAAADGEHAVTWRIPIIPGPETTTNIGQGCPLRSPRATPLSIFPPRLRRIAGIAETLTGVPMLSGNEVKPLFNGEEAYPPMLEAIRTARRRVWLTTYIFDNDNTGKAFIEALAGAVERGADVRVLVDGVGTFLTRPRIDKALARRGVKVARFLPPRLWPPQFSINLRNHRKLLIVDNCVSFTGGMNISDTHLTGKPEARGLTRIARKLHGAHTAKDIHFQVSGPIVNTLQRIFARDWEFCAHERLELGPADVCREIKGNAFCRAILDGPDDFFDVFHSVLLGVISSAKSSIHIMTPYFLPQRELITALQSAVLRGVDVAVIIPGESDHKFVKWATYNCLWDLLGRGVKIYFQPPPFDHSKLLLVDGSYVHMGSANMDTRSFRLNFELTMEVLNLPLAAGLEEYFKKVLANSAQYTMAQLNARPLHVKLRDAVFWLMSPYL